MSSTIQLQLELLAKDKFSKVMDDLGAKANTVGGKLTSAWTTAREKVNQFGNSILSIQGALAAAGLYKIIGFAADSVREFGKGQRAALDLQMTLEGMGKNAPGLADQLRAVAVALQETSTFDDDDILQATATLAGFAKITAEQLPAATQATVDLAAKLGIDLPMAARMVGQTSEGITGILSRYGIKVSEVAARSGDFGKVLEDLNRKIAGSAEAFATTGIGSLEKLERYWSQLKEKLGGRIVLAIEVATGAATEQVARQITTYKEGEDAARAMQKAATEGLPIQQVQIEQTTQKIKDWEQSLAVLREKNKGLTGFFVSDTLLREDEKRLAKMREDVVRWQAELAEIQAPTAVAPTPTVGPSIGGALNVQLRILAAQMKEIEDQRFAEGFAEMERSFEAVAPAIDTAAEAIDDGNVGMATFSAGMSTLTGTLREQADAWAGVEGATAAWNEQAEQVDFWATQNTATVGGFSNAMLLLNTEAAKLNEEWAGVEGATVAWEEAGQRGVKTWTDKLGEMAKATEGLGRALESNIAGAFESLMMGKAVTFRQFMQGLYRDLAAAQAKLMAQEFVSQLGVGEAPKEGAKKSLVGQGIGLLGSLVGGWLGGGGAPAPKGAGGGITQGVTIAGEAGPEAIVPLPGGRSIPVQMQGGGRSVVVNFNITAMDTQSAAQVIMANKGAVKSLVLEAVGSDVDFRRQVRGG